MGGMIYIANKFIFLVNNRRFEYARGLYRRQDIPLEHIRHPYAAGHMAEPDEHQEREEFRQPKELPRTLVGGRPPNLARLRNRKATA